MVCIAAFIILGIIGIFVAILSIFKREIGRAYWRVFKKSLGCVSKKVRLQKCDTNFKDDVKNALFKRLVLKHPTWLKPLSAMLEVLSVLFVAVFLWAVLTSIKSLLSLWALGTCNVDRPASCTLSSEACSLGDDNEAQTFWQKTGRWFTEWGDIFEALPDRVKSWRAEEYLLDAPTFVDASLLDSSKSAPKADAPVALDIVDPGCSACMMSFRNQLESGFFETHKTAILVYPIEISDGEYKFKNSEVFARFFYASALFDRYKPTEDQKHYDLKLLNRLFTERTDKGIIYQGYLASLSSEDAEAELARWLTDFGATEDELSTLSQILASDEVTAILSTVKNIAEHQVHIKGIPTLVYDGRKHLGLYEI